jgi:hypothetical protein
MSWHSDFWQWFINVDVYVEIQTNEFEWSFLACKIEKLRLDGFDL